MRDECKRNEGTVGQVGGRNDERPTGRQVVTTDSRIIRSGLNGRKRVKKEEGRGRGGKGTKAHADDMKQGQRTPWP